MRAHVSVQKQDIAQMVPATMQGMYSSQIGWLGIKIHGRHQVAACLSREASEPALDTAQLQASTIK